MKTARIILIYLAAALAAAVCGVLFGAARIPLNEFIQDGALNPIVELRIVRTAAAAVVGASLAVSGLVFQAVLRNSLAEPFLLGVSGAFTYLLTYLLIRGLTAGITAVSPGAGKTVNSLLWGFNFIIGSLVAVLVKLFLSRMKRLRFMERQYQNNYLLNRISGFAFDLMIVAGIASIRLEDLSGLWLPFVLLTHVS